MEKDLFEEKIQKQKDLVKAAIEKIVKLQEEIEFDNKCWLEALRSIPNKYANRVIEKSCELHCGDKNGLHN
jgi:uncharacterized protein YjgD (DUF1641 family)